MYNKCFENLLFRIYTCKGEEGTFIEIGRSRCLSGQKMGYVQAKIGLTGQFDWHLPGNYLKLWEILNFLSPIFGLIYMHIGDVSKKIIILTVNLPKK